MYMCAIAGMVNLTNYFDAVSIANDSFFSFVNLGFINSTVLPLVDSNLGAVLQVELSRNSYAMVGVSLMTTAFPKIIYDKNRIRSWDGSVGTAVGVNGNVDNVARTIDGASVSPQIGQFLDMSMGTTKSLLGASDVAMGDSRPDNTSAIIALQRAANTPMEMTRQNMYEQVDDLARIFKDIMSVRYGVRKVEVGLQMDKPGQQPLGMELEPDG